ncbi:MAG: D-TA family PLP-dependent enzyme [Gemmatimonadales bacterium]|nr:MAG: D-TA family PLP-dependent enzyme [Gemmatimonadales bacterium]
MGRVSCLRDLETPVGLVDVSRMRANLMAAGDYCKQWRIGYRPHAKSHTSAELAKEQLKVGALGMTVATPREAEVMARVTDDILVAYPPVGPARLARLLSLPERVRLTVALDSAEALRPLAREARAKGRQVGVLVEVDVGLGRVGVQSVGELLGLAREVADTQGVEYRGLMLYPGHIRMPVPEQTGPLRALSEVLEAILDALGRGGLAPEVVSGGSTPTFSRSHEVAGVTEVRPGTGIFNDRTTALLEACAWTDCAYSVLATVVSTSVPGQVVVDAGSKALAKEEIRAVFSDPEISAGYGCLLDQPGLRVTALSEEHGVIELGDGSWQPRPGDLVRVVPNHVCVSVNLQDRLWQVSGDEVLGWWEVEARRH